jgi:ArsR family transcriptional regulator
MKTALARTQPVTDDVPSLFRVFADETRLRILNLLLDGELCVCDLCAILGQSQPKISRHLAYLRGAGLVVARDAGRWKYYSIPKGRPPIERRLLECIRGCLRGLDPLAGDLAALAKKKRARC